MKSKRTVPKLTDLREPKQILNLIQNQVIRDLISAIAMFDGTMPPDERPEWVIKAAGEFYRCCQETPRTKHAKSEAYRFGLMWGFASRATPQSMENEPALAALLNPAQLNQV